MNDKIEAFILRQQDYRDYDSLLTIYSKEYGKLSFIASGVRKANSKNATSLIPNSLVEIIFDYKANKNIFRLKSMRTKKLYRHMHEDLECYSAASIVSDVFLSIVTDEDDSEYLFSFLKKSFSLFNEEEDSALILALSLIDLMEYAGIGIAVDGCVSCGKSRVVAFSEQEGGFLCEDCANHFHIKHQTREELRYIYFVVKSGLEHYAEIKGKVKVNRSLIVLLQRFIERHLGIHIASIPLYIKLFAIE